MWFLMIKTPQTDFTAQYQRLLYKDLFTVQLLMLHRFSPIFKSDKLTDKLAQFVSCSHNTYHTTLFK